MVHISMSSANKVNFTVDQLTSNLITLLGVDYEPVDDHFLVGKTASHRVEDGWKKGDIISQVPGFPDWFNILYENDSTIYTHRLLGAVSNCIHFPRVYKEYAGGGGGKHQSTLFVC